MFFMLSSLQILNVPQFHLLTSQAKPFQHFIPSSIYKIFIFSLYQYLCPVSAESRGTWIMSRHDKVGVPLSWSNGDTQFTIVLLAQFLDGVAFGLIGGYINVVMPGNYWMVPASRQPIPDLPSPVCCLPIPQNQPSYQSLMFAARHIPDHKPGAKAWDLFLEEINQFPFSFTTKFSVKHCILLILCLYNLYRSIMACATNIWVFIYHTHVTSSLKWDFAYYLVTYCPLCPWRICLW